MGFFPGLCFFLLRPFIRSFFPFERIRVMNRRSTVCVLAAFCLHPFDLASPVAREVNQLLRHDVILAFLFLFLSFFLVDEAGRIIY